MPIYGHKPDDEMMERIWKTLEAIKQTERKILM